MDSEKKEARLLDVAQTALAMGVRRRTLVRWMMTCGARGEHWDAPEGVLGITDAGAKAAAKSMGQRLSKKTAAPLEKRDGAETVKVVRGSQNVKIVLCVKIADNTVCTVRVRDNRPFRFGDVFDAERTENGLAYFGQWPERGW